MDLLEKYYKETYSEEMGKYTDLPEEMKKDIADSVGFAFYKLGVAFDKLIESILGFFR